MTIEGNLNNDEDCERKIKNQKKRKRSNEDVSVNKKVKIVVEFMTNNSKVIFWNPSIEKNLKRKQNRGRLMEKGLENYIINLGNKYLEKIPYYYNSYKRISNLDFIDLPETVIKETHTKLDFDTQIN